ncbi:MAG: chromate transporter [Betaproteobacteria bacterium]
MIPIEMGAADWLQMLLHFATLSLLGVGGAITTLPDMHRYLVDQQSWLSDTQFNASVALAQAAPGPNILFVALMGWHVGLNAGAGPLSLMGALLALLGTMLPSSLLVYAAGQWSHRNRERRIIRAFKQGLAPTVVGLLVATGIVLAAASAGSDQTSLAWVMAGVATVLMWRTRLHVLWLLAAGALAGAFWLR